MNHRTAKSLAAFAALTALMLPPGSVRAEQKCTDNFCVGDQVLTDRGDTGPVVGILPNGQIMVSVATFELPFYPQDLAIPQGCANSLCVGDKVLNKSGQDGKIVGLFPATGKIGVKSGIHIYKYDPADIAVAKGCLESLCVTDKVVTAEGDSGRVVGIFPMDRTLLVVVGDAYRSYKLSALTRDQ